jgi:hypothetical protein
VRVNFAAVAVRDRFDDRKTEPGAAAPAASASLGSPEPLEQVLAGIGGDPGLP